MKKIYVLGAVCIMCLFGLTACAANDADEGTDGIYNGVDEGINNGVYDGVDDDINNGVVDDINNGTTNGTNNGITNGTNNSITNGTNNGVNGTNDDSIVDRLKDTVDGIGDGTDTQDENVTGENQE